MENNAMKGEVPAGREEPLCGGVPQSGVCPDPGSYRELSPHQFNALKELSVIVLKEESGVEAFQGFSEVRFLPTSADIEGLLAGWPCERTIGLVCPDGACSSRLAIRLSRRGYRVCHLAGGLREWYQCSLA